jgi:TPR repeat protein
VRSLDAIYRGSGAPRRAIACGPARVRCGGGGRFAAVLFLACAFATFVSAARAERRVALIVGNTAYHYAAPLRTPSADADGVAALLRTLDFNVVELKDVDKPGMEQAVRRFSAEIDGADIALFYYSGHAVEVGALNYLIPTSARIDGPRSLALDAIALQDVSSAMRQAGAKVQLLFLDACRDNPYETAYAPPRAGATNRGLAPVGAASGSLIAFSTQPGQVARDGTGEMSPFTTGFVRYARLPNLDVRQVLNRVRSYVLEDTDNQQVPWDNSSLVADVFLVPKRPPPKFEKLLSAVVTPGAGAQTLRLAPPVQPEGGEVLVTIEQRPAYGHLTLDSRGVAESEAIPAADFARLAYESTSPKPEDSFSYRVDDAWGNTGVGLVKIMMTQAVAASPAPESPPLDIDVSAISLIGLGPNLIYRRPPSFATPASGRDLRLQADIPFGQMVLGDRVIEKGRLVDLADVVHLKFEPQPRSDGKHVVALFTTTDGSPGEVKVGIDVRMTDCDRLAGDRLDAQGAGEGVVTGQIDLSAALPACELAHNAQPDSGRFNYQLGRVYAALGRDGDAVAAYQRADSQGYIRARYALGYHFVYVPPLDPARGKEFLEQASAAGDVFASYALGQLYYEGRGVAKDLVKAKGLFEAAARMGHTYAMNSLGRMYQYGEAVSTDVALARRYWEESAARGDLYGINNLGIVYRDGIAAPKDPGKALVYFKQATALGHPESPGNIGLLYLRGDGVPVDFTAARKWFAIGMERGDAYGAFYLGEMSRLGWGGPIDDTQAAYHYARAAAAINRIEPADRAREQLSRLGESKKLAALRLLLGELDPANAKAPEAALRDLAQRAIAAKGLKPIGASLEALLIGTAQALWLSRKVRTDLF